jgi:hypothetical protein
MSLLDELKQQKAEIAERLERACADVQYFDGRMADLLLAIAALEPTPATIVNTDEGWELEPSPAELFAAEKSEAREQLEREDDASEFAAPMPDPEFVVLDEQTCEPVEEAPALNADMQDERELTAQNDYDSTGVLTADDLQGGAMPNFAEYPAPVTEGYAPVVDALVTNPEADALARAHDWYSPEKVAERNKFNPWGIFGKKLEDA